ncbi:MAG: hypothetical protein QOF78_3915 [Phycisphaerales bacterium]|jgi:hypothetical protein|nr:hypothetical protein [Phycisphaerales bacterium]
MRLMTPILAIVLAVLAQAQTTQPAPPTSQGANVQLWLDRAEAEVRAVVAQPTRDPAAHFAVKLDLALALAQTRGNDADRTLLRHALAQPMPPPGPRETPEMRELSLHYLRSLSHAALGEPDAARAEAQAFDRAVEELPNVHIGRLLVGPQVAMMYAKIGDVEAATAGALKYPIFDDDTIGARMMVARELHAAGNRKARDEVIAEAIAEAMKIPDANKRAGALRSIVSELAEAGDMKAALSLAEQMPAQFQRVDAYRKLAAIFAARADASAATACVTAALDTLVGLDELSSSMLYVQVGELAVALNQPDAARRAVVAIEKQYNDSAAWTADAWTLAHAARIAAAIDEKAAYARLVKATEKVIDRLNDTKDKSRATMLLAAAIARAGDKPRATEMLLHAKKLHAEENYENADALFDALDAFMEIGETEHAHQLAAREFGLATKDLEYPYELSLARYLRDGKFDAARADAGRITNPPRRFHALLHVALRQTRAGQADPVTESIQSLASPADRAALYLALAQQALGIDPRSWLRDAYK